MRRLIEEPVTEVDGDRGSVTKHPAFGQIAISRVSGHSVLYGSDFAHRSSIRISIAHSELHRDLYRDWHFARGQMIEVELSEAQWATFVSSMNAGSGVPCTVRHVGGEWIARLPDPTDRVEQFNEEIGAKLRGNIESVRASIAEIENLGLSKAKTEKVKSALQKTLQDLEQNLPFAAQSFGQHAEKLVEKAKIEIHGYMNNEIARAGLEVLRSEAPLQLVKPKDEE